MSNPLNPAEVTAWLREQAEEQMTYTFSAMDQEEAECLENAKRYATAADLIESLAAERDAWTETARNFANNADYYQGLLKRIADALGKEAYTADSGDVYDSPLNVKIPELVDAVIADPDALAAMVVVKDEALRQIAYECIDTETREMLRPGRDSFRKAESALTLKLPAAAAQVAEWQEKSLQWDKYMALHESDRAAAKEAENANKA